MTDYEFLMVSPAELGELLVWIKTPRDTKKLEAIENANREFSVAIEGVRRWISEKY